jgi:hypothetical protein
VQIFNADDEGSYPALLENVTLAEVNTAPAAPNAILGNVTGSELHVTYFVAEIRYREAPAAYGPYSTFQTSTLRPGQVVPLTYPANPPGFGDPGDQYTVRITSYTSNDTAGTPWTLEVTFP